MSNTILLTLVTGSFLLAFILASLAEYWAHRLMHTMPHLCPSHIEHHQLNTGQGVLGEFRDYVLPGLPFVGLICLLLWKIGLGMVGLSHALGALFYAAFAAYSHQLQHDNPAKCAWMIMPVHYVHHQYDQWHHNFGIAVDWWDRIFATYKPVEWSSTIGKDKSNKGFLQVRWW
ncbi:hypothetical protein S7335_526 [Synechococcus sp. PCC 7335]|uniref:sterol desaturase family protein n=1 Tax=Synechococcus sp. (strain ATCC 29403 / PCC 7335) TaxID=91464 RepID=UPI00017EE4A5|nr:sterol desaturase family protein [Synechococcus sp. PCC 7335]EDX83346.1 hypothetical protein S7335_526 [Synechococcus sp. PCC 7335]